MIDPTITQELRAAGLGDLSLRVTRERLQWLREVAARDSLLREIRDYLRDFADVVDGSDGTQQPNAIMSMQVAFEDRLWDALGARKP